MRAEPLRARFVVLDALRGIAGLCVPLFHLSEAFNRPHAGAASVEQVCGHGYLAVEFFLLLMGYMLGYAYDRRWREGMGCGAFFVRRLKRLHPCVLSGLALGFLVYLVQLASGEPFFPWMVKETAGGVAWIVIAGALMIPAFGATMLGPLNACAWTLYYEYLGNILYGLFVRRLGRKTLLALSILAGLWAASFILRIDLNALFGTSFPLLAKAAARCDYTLVGGWSLNDAHFYCGMVRLLFPLFFGLLLFRLGWKIRLPLKVALPLAVVVFLAVLFTPFPYTLGAPGAPWVNGVFELLAIMVVFPLLILIGVGSEGAVGGRVTKVATFFAALSYPLYMSHYPLIEVHNWWVWNRSADLSPLTCAALSAVEFVAYVALAYAVMRFWNWRLSSASLKGK